MAIENISIQDPNESGDTITVRMNVVEYCLEDGDITCVVVKPVSGGRSVAVQVADIETFSDGSGRGWELPRR